MNSAELIRMLRKAGVRFEPMRGGSGHRWATLGDKRTIVPVHGGRKEIPTGTVNRILKNLGLK